MKRPIRKVSSNMITIVWSFLLLCPEVIAQNPQELDSLNQLLVQASHDSSKVRILWDLGRQYHRTMPDSAFTYYQKALDISTELDLREDIAITLQKIGTLLIVTGEYDPATKN